MDDTPDTEQREVLVVGAGPGGYVAAIRAAQLGKDVLLVDRDAVGGTCLNYGCIPSKALIEAADRVQSALDARAMGVYADPYVDGADLHAWKDGVVADLTAGVERRCRAAGVELRSGTATFVAEDAVAIRRDGDTDRRVAFEDAVVATGSRPLELPGFDFDAGPVLDARQLFALERVPEDVLVVGAGYIGMELSTTLAKLGAAVTVVEALDSVLPGYPADLTAPVRRRGEELGVEFALGRTARGWRRTAEGVAVETETGDGDVTEFDCAEVLVAVGRQPVTDTLDLGAAGLSTDEDGFLPTDDQCRTERDNVYAVGDVAGEPLLAHEASAAGVVAAETIAGRTASMADRAVPAVVYTDPEIATVGLTAADARERGLDPLVGTAPFAASGRAMTVDEPRGFVRVVADQSNEVVLGGHVVGPEAAELAGELAVAVETGATLSAVAATIHAHPTLAESIGEAVEDALGQAIHVPEDASAGE